MLTSPKSDKQDEVRDAVDRLNSEVLSADQFMNRITLLLNEQMLKYSWVGFYMLEHGAQPPVLVLGHYQGAMTPHTRIHLNQGICGAAASSGKTVVVDDVSKDSRYLACSLETKSEIVVPISCAARSSANSTSIVIFPLLSARMIAISSNIARNSSASDWTASPSKLGNSSGLGLMKQSSLNNLHEVVLVKRLP